MEYRRLGKTGLKVSAFSLGSWVTFANQVDLKPAVEMMGAAYDAGVNFFDNAEGYAAGESEVVMGKALKELGWRRDSYAVSSKVFFGAGATGPMQRGLSAKHVHDACHDAMKRLQVDYLDLLFCHRPDLDTPIVETVRAMDNLIRQGKVIYWGTSEWTAQQITEAHAAAREWGLTPPVMEQPQYNMFERQKVESDYVPLYDTFGLGTTIWSPLASGLLTGKYNEGIPEDSRMKLKGYEWLRERFESADGQQKLAKVKELAKIADGAGMSITHMALLWCLQNPRVSTVILGASKPAQLTDNLAALDHGAKMTPDLMAAIDKVLDNTPAPPQRY